MITCGSFLCRQLPVGWNRIWDDKAIKEKLLLDCKLNGYRILPSMNRGQQPIPYQEHSGDYFVFRDAFWWNVWRCNLYPRLFVALVPMPKATPSLVCLHHQSVQCNPGAEQYDVKGGTGVGCERDQRWLIHPSTNRSCWLLACSHTCTQRDRVDHEVVYVKMTEYVLPYNKIFSLLSFSLTNLRSWI